MVELLIQSLKKKHINQSIHRRVSISQPSKDFPKEDDHVFNEILFEI